MRDIKDDAWLLSEDAYALYSACMGHPSIDTYREKMRLLRAEEGSCVYAALQDDETVGMIALHAKADDTAEIEGIAVREDMRRQGIGTQLLRAAALAMHAPYVTAETDDDGAAFYRATGFAVQAFTRHFEDGDCTRYVCRLDMVTCDRRITMEKQA